MQIKKTQGKSYGFCLLFKPKITKIPVKTLFKKALKDFQTDIIGIDLGTCNTLICNKDGILLNENSNLAYISETMDKSEVYAFGTKANDLIGRTPFKIDVKNPICDGVVNNISQTEELLNIFLTKTFKKKIAQPIIIVGVPFNATNVEQVALSDILERCNAKKVFFIYESLASAIGAGARVKEAIGNIVIDIGGGTTEISVISLGGIIKNQSFRCGGQHIDKMIQEYVQHKYNIALSLVSAEEIKKNIGCAFVVNEKNNGKFKISGRDLSTNKPKNIEITAKDTSVAMAEFTNLLVDNLKAVLSATPPELIEDITNNGIFLCGGGARIKNLDYVIEQTTNLKSTICEQPELCLIKGLQKIIQNFKDYQQDVLFQIKY